MDLFETLKQFKAITPDAAYKESSKRAVLAMLPREPWSMKRMLAAILETGAAVALSAFFILALTGQFSNAPYVSPVQFSVIDPQTLHAEAQAVDIQIQLANIAYQEASTTAPSGQSGLVAVTGGETTKPAAFAPAVLRASNIIASSSTNQPSPSSTTAAAAISVDDALKALAQ